MAEIRSWFQKSLVRLILLALTVSVLGVVLGEPASAQVEAVDPPILLGQEQPYQPDVTNIAPPDWLEGLGPLSSLPVWAIAAILAAVVAALFVVVPAAVKWVWVWRSTRDSET